MGKMLTQAQVAKKLGCGKTKVSTLCREEINPLPSFKFGRMVRIDETDLNEWLDKKRASEETEHVLAEDLFEETELESGGYILVRRKDIIAAIDLLAKF